VKTNWDYSERAHTYDNRADYGFKAISNLLNKINCLPTKVVADIGAGTGKLTKHIIKTGVKVKAVEPNNNMSSYGKKNIVSDKVDWIKGTGEKTNLSDNSVHAVLFGSSFNVVDQMLALQETKRILKKGGFFACMWNHRDTDNPIQKKIENIIKLNIPNYSYGLRREDPSKIINKSGFFGKVSKINESFEVEMKRETIIKAWKSHDTLYRQSGNKFDKIINEISEVIQNDSYMVPYSTNIWFAKLSG
tara:strand:+ start:1150 stop:1890 length:741 start_codon:yes stop_codon:yes gene_type:complete